MNRELSLYRNLDHIHDPSDPSSIDELCFPSEAAKRVLVQWTRREGHSKNLLLYGPPGSGKTRAAYVLCRERLGQRSLDWTPITYFPCESGTFDRALQRVKGEYDNFQKLSDPDFEQFHVLDEFDNFRSTQQVQMKQVLEQNDVTFVLITNRVIKVDPAIRNRCLEVHWHIPAPEICLPRLRQLADADGSSTITDATLTERVYSVGGWRQMLRNLDHARSAP